MNSLNVLTIITSHTTCTTTLRTRFDRMTHVCDIQLDTMRIGDNIDNDCDHLIDEEM